jgi:hypothetical protein
VGKNVTCRGYILDKPSLMFYYYEIEETGKVQRYCISENDKMFVLLGEYGRNDGGCIKKIEDDNRTKTICYCDPIDNTVLIDHDLTVFKKRMKTELCIEAFQ